MGLEISFAFVKATRPDLDAAEQMNLQRECQKKTRIQRGSQQWLFESKLKDGKFLDHPKLGHLVNRCSVHALSYSWF